MLSSPNDEPQSSGPPVRSPRAWNRATHFAVVLWTILALSVLILPHPRLTPLWIVLVLRIVFLAGMLLTFVCCAHSLVEFTRFLIRRIKKH